MRKKTMFMIFLVQSTLMMLSGCPYHVSGRYNGLPEGINTIAVLPFENLTTKAVLSSLFTEAVKKEFARRTSYRIISHVEGADAVLKARLKSYVVTPIGVKHQNVGTSFMILIKAEVMLTRTRDGKLLYKNTNCNVREEYILSERKADFYFEEKPAIERAARKFADSVVSTILETF